MPYRTVHSLALLLALLLGACGAHRGAAPPTTAPLRTAGDAAAPSAAPPTAAPSPASLDPTTPAASPTLGPGMFVNPVIDQDFPDPDTLKVGDHYYAYATGNFEAGISVQAARSRDLVRWEILPDAMPVFPPWAEPDHGLVWAPEVTNTADGGAFLLYFTARVAGTNTQCIGMASSPAPEGPFESTAEQPMICQRDQGGSIDASSFVDEDGTRYLLWKNDGNCCGGETWIYIQQISADGRALEGEPARLIRADQSWEGKLVEAPTLWKREGRYYLFYSANDYNTPGYTVGYAVADAPLGPYQKAEGPLLASNIRDAVVGPGGQDIVVDADGDTWLLYHSWGPGYRSMSIDELVWERGAPAILGPDGRRTPQAVP